jgi:hypothetical protein
MGTGPVYAAQAVIPAGSAVSGVIDLGSAHFLALYLPTVMTGTGFTFQGAAGLGVGDSQADAEAATFTQIFDEAGAAVVVVFAQNTCVGLGAAVMARLGGFQYIKLVSNAPGAGFELAQRVIGLGLKV